MKPLQLTASFGSEFYSPTRGQIRDFRPFIVRAVEFGATRVQLWAWEHFWSQQYAQFFGTLLNFCESLGLRVSVKFSMWTEPDEVQITMMDRFPQVEDWILGNEPRLEGASFEKVIGDIKRMLVEFGPEKLVGPALAGEIAGTPGFWRRLSSATGLKRGAINIYAPANGSLLQYDWLHNVDAEWIPSEMGIHPDSEDRLKLADFILAADDRLPFDRYSHFVLTPGLRWSLLDYEAKPVHPACDVLREIWGKEGVEPMPAEMRIEFYQHLERQRAGTSADPFLFGGFQTRVFFSPQIWDVGRSGFMDFADDAFVPYKWEHRQMDGSGYEFDCVISGEHPREYVGQVEFRAEMKRLDGTETRWISAPLWVLAKTEGDLTVPSAEEPVEEPEAPFPPDDPQQPGPPEIKSLLLEMIDRLKLMDTQLLALLDVSKGGHVRVAARIAEARKNG